MIVAAILLLSDGSIIMGSQYSDFHEVLEAPSLGGISASPR